jgi:hypothetical protein
LYFEDDDEHLKNDKYCLHLDGSKFIQFVVVFQRFSEIERDREILYPIGNENV